MRHLFTVLFLCTGLFFSRALCAHPGTDSDPNQQLILSSTTFTPEAVSINYEIPFGGMILFNLYNDEEEIIWKTQAARERGTHTILLKANKFDQGKRYHFEIEYKGKVYSGEFEGR